MGQLPSEFKLLIAGHKSPRYSLYNIGVPPGSQGFARGYRCEPIFGGTAWTISMEPKDVKMQIKDLEYMFSAESSRFFVEKPRATEMRYVATAGREIPYRLPEFSS